MTLKIAYNNTDAPVLVDEWGYTIGGRSWGVVETTQERYQAEVAAGRIADADADALAASENPDALAALEALQHRSEAVTAARALSKDELVAALPPEVVADLPEGGDGLPSKDDLVAAAVDNDAELPEADKKATTTKSRAAAKK